MVANQSFKDVVLLLGSNQGDRLFYLQKASELIEENMGELLKKSRIYESEAWGFEAETNFLNQVLIVKTKYNPMQILERIFTIEKKLQRVRSKNGYTSRTIDIDILFYGDELIDTKRLSIPHPLLQERKFTLLPLVEVLPNMIHPLFQKTIKELLDECKDKTKLWLWDE